VYVGLLLGAPLGEAVLTRLGFLAVWLLAAIARTLRVAAP
jgi:hypothetical protein